MRKMLWAWKSVSGRKSRLSFIPLTIFYVVRKEMNRRAFQGVEDDADQVRARCQTFGLVD